MENEDIKSNDKKRIQSWVKIGLVIVILLALFALSVFLWNLAGPQPMTVLTQKDFRRLR